LIELSEKGGYEPALLNVGRGRQELNTNMRNNSRHILDDEQLADALWFRVKDLVPDEWNDFPVVGLNERFRFLRYDPGERFNYHQDGNYQRPDGSETSFLSFLLYLNEGFVGGETAFARSNKKIKVTPKTGRVLIYEHSLNHEGAV
ncbi:652_t:CDS:1, partial [Acaulospora morrowiae]